jgi:hypothetical protein
MVYSGARGTLIYEKNLKSKFSCQTPFKHRNIKGSNNKKRNTSNIREASNCRMPQTADTPATGGTLAISGKLYTVKNANRIPGFPWNLSFLIRENTPLRGKFCTLPILDFLFFQLEKVFRDLKRYKNPGLGMKSSTPTPQSWKHPGNLLKSRKYPGNLVKSRKYPGNLAKTQK